jgi:hypothetical protein
MGVITPDRFNPIKAFCNVRLQQGVPLVDADVNELDDIRKFEVRAFLKWFVGDGVPDGNDGFRVAAATSPAPDDFQILAGGQLSGPAPDPNVPSPALNEFALQRCGRCIVDGLDVMIRADATYKGQPLYTAAAYGVPQVAPIPNVAGQVLVYLDVWERLIAPTDDGSLIVPPLGMETCARMKREWVVRTRLGTSVPVQGDADFLPSHSYYGLASVNRRMVSGSPAPILSTDITDLRERGLSIPPSTLITDVMGGTEIDYRRGLNRPAGSLRDAINALALGEVPSQARRPVAPDMDPSLAQYDASCAADPSGGVLAVWSREIAGSQYIFVARLDTRNPSAGFTAPLQIARGYSPPYSPLFLPHVLCLPGGDVLVSYGGDRGSGGADILFKRASSLAGLVAAAEQPVANTPGISEEWPFAVVSGNVVVFFYCRRSGDGQWQRRRYQHVSDTWLDTGGTDIVGANESLHAAADDSGSVWVASVSEGGSDLRVFRLNVATNVADLSTIFFPPETAADYSVRHPFVLCAAGKVWLFWDSGLGGIYYARWSGTSWSPMAQLSYTAVNDRHPIAVLDPGGRIALVFARKVLPKKLYGPNDLDLYLMHGDPNTGGWFPPAVVATSDGDNVPRGLVSASGSLWLLWLNELRNYYRQIFSPL